MQVIKLDAIPSTNDFLKEMAASGPVRPFTVAVAETQTKGRGQAGASWLSEPGKNLTFSVYVPNSVTGANKLFGLNIVVALSVAQVLRLMEIPRVQVKWPNDILSGNKKLCGILIENTIGDTINSIIGIGLNVNQGNFDGLPSATSMLAVTGEAYDRELILSKIIGTLKSNLEELSRDTDAMWQQYHEILFMAGKAAMFATPEGDRFMAVVKGVNFEGKIVLEREGGDMEFYAVREVQMIY